MLWEADPVTVCFFLNKSEVARAKQNLSTLLGGTSGNWGFSNKGSRGTLPILGLFWELRKVHTNKLARGKG